MPEIVTPGTRLGERYLLEEPLGTGGMATVWRATDDVLDRAVAVKVPREDWPKQFTRRLHREAKAAAGLAHPSITAVYDYGESELPGGTRVPYVVMELLEGETLGARLARGPLPWHEAAAVCARIADALAAAHAKGVVHRDIKPGNVFLTPTGVKVLDFGIAFTGSSGNTGPLMGTRAYVAPELIEGRTTSPKADLFSLGVVLRETLTGRRTSDRARLPAEVPEDVAELCRRCLEDKPKARPDAAEAARVLSRAAGIRLVRLPSAPRSPAPAEPGRSRRPTLELPGGVRKPLIIAGAAVGVLSLAAVLVAVFSPDESGSSSALPGIPPATAPSRSPEPSPASSSPTPTGTPQCVVSYAIDNAWPQGFQARVRITNIGAAPINGWRVVWRFPDGEQVTQLWNGSQEQRGATVTVTAADWNRSIPPRGTVEFGFLGRRDGGGNRPAAFTLNGGPCRTA